MSSLLFLCSALVLIFYVYKILNGGNKVYLPVSAEWIDWIEGTLCSNGQINVKQTVSVVYIHCILVEHTLYLYTINVKYAVGTTIRTVSMH
jgi:hypothetical protein